MCVYIYKAVFAYQRLNKDTFWWRRFNLLIFIGHISANTQRSASRNQSEEPRENPGDGRTDGLQEAGSVQMFLRSRCGTEERRNQVLRILDPQQMIVEAAGSNTPERDVLVNDDEIWNLMCEEMLDLKVTHPVWGVKTMALTGRHVNSVKVSSVLSWGAEIHSDRFNRTSCCTNSSVMNLIQFQLCRSHYSDQYL